MPVEVKTAAQLGIDMTGADLSTLYRPMTLDQLTISLHLEVLLGYWSSLVIEENGSEEASLPRRSRKGFKAYLRKRNFPREMIDHVSQLNDKLADMKSCQALAVARFMIVADLTRPKYMLHRDYLAWTTHQEVPLYVDLESYARLSRTLDCFNNPV